MTYYAENRISGLLENKYDKSEIINNLEENAFNKHKDYKLIFWMKSGEFIKISYLDEDNKQFNEKVKLLDFDGDMLKKFARYFIIWFTIFYIVIIQIYSMAELLDPGEKTTDKIGKK